MIFLLVLSRCFQLYFMPHEIFYIFLAHYFTFSCSILLITFTVSLMLSARRVDGGHGRQINTGSWGQWSRWWSRGRVSSHLQDCSCKKTPPKNRQPLKSEQTPWLICPKTKKQIYLRPSSNHLLLEWSKSF